MPSSPAAVVLAAGMSRRLGRPKALVAVNGLTLVEWSFKRLHEHGCRVVVVVNPDIAERVAVLLPDAHLVVNNDPDAGRMRSLQLGCSAIAKENGSLPERLVMAPVDRPGWNAEVLNTLLSASSSAAPAYKSRRGHPVLLDASAIGKVMTAEHTASLRELVSFAPVPVEAPWLHLNIDTADDVNQLMENDSALLSCFPEGEGI